MADYHINILLGQVSRQLKDTTFWLYYARTLMHLGHVVGFLQLSGIKQYIGQIHCNKKAGFLKFLGI